MFPTVISMESESCDGSEWDTLVRWTEQDVKSGYSRGAKDLRVSIGGGVEEGAGVEETSVEEIGRDPGRANPSLSFELVVRD